MQERFPGPALSLLCQEPNLGQTDALLCSLQLLWAECGALVTPQRHCRPALLSALVSEQLCKSKDHFNTLKLYLYW